MQRKCINCEFARKVRNVIKNCILVDCLHEEYMSLKSMKEANYFNKCFNFIKKENK